MTTISQNGGIIYIQQSASNIQYQSNSTSGSWTTISSWPATFTNSNPSSGNILTVSLFSNITVSSTQGLNGYFITGSNYITYDGTSKTVTISGLTGYTGFIQNGTSTTDGYHTVTVQNIKSALASASTLTTSGWICQSYFGKNIKNISGYNAGTNLITVTNCSNSATVGSSNGGICGQYFGYNADATITNCFNTGVATGGSCGGIVSSDLANTGGIVTITNCYNTGNVGANSGGICSIRAGSANGKVTISNCYNTGAIGGNGGGGGIAGSQLGYNTNNICSISNCYNTGAIATTSTTTGPGGICGRGAGNNTAAISYTPTINITNCYNLGTISNGTGSPVIGCAGILGGNPITASTNTPTITITNCYSVNPASSPSLAITTMTTPAPTQTNCFSYTTWTDSNASAALTGYPTSISSSNPGTTWTTVVTDTPYILTSFNSQIYDPNVYSNPTLPTYTTIPGSFSSADGYAYTLLNANTNNVSINSTTGELTFTNLVSNFSYTANVFVSKGTSPSYTSYNSSTFTLNNVICFKESTKILCFTEKEEYIPIQDLKPGDLVKTFSSGFKKIENIGYARVYYDVKQNGHTTSNLYRLCKTNYPELFEDLIITGGHAILVDDFKDDNEKNKVVEIYKRIYQTDNKYNLLACVDERASVYEVEGVHVVWHFSLESDDDSLNYGVYANGLLVEACSKRYLKEVGCLTLVV